MGAICVVGCVVSGTTLAGVVVVVGGAEVIQVVQQEALISTSTQRSASTLVHQE